MSFHTLAERTHGCSVELPGSEQDGLERFLQKPKRTMAALLSRERMTPLGQGRFLYQSRPFRLLQFEITPVVVFQAVWQNRCLRIEFEDCQLKGLGVVQEAIRFECRAVLTPGDQRLDAEATAALAIAERHPLQRLQFRDGVLGREGPRPCFCTSGTPLSRRFASCGGTLDQGLSCG